MFLIDYQPSQIKSVRSMDKDLLLKNIVSTTKLAKLFGVPIVHSTVNVVTGRGRATHFRRSRSISRMKAQFSMIF